MIARLQKVIAHAGISSRRAAETLMREGRVTVNGRVATELGMKVDPEADAIKVDGKRLPPPPAVHAYYLLHKPRGVVTTLSDPEGRMTVRDLLRGVRERVYPVGRLDWDTEGLLLLTDDGDLARDLMHPSSAVRKTYLAKVRGVPSESALERLRTGIVLTGRRTLPAVVRLVRRPGDNPWIEITIVEGRNRQVRRMLEAIGHPVQKLRRTAYAGLEIGNLPVGGFRRLTPGEVERLRRAGRPTARPKARRDRRA